MKILNWCFSNASLKTGHRRKRVRCNAVLWELVFVCPYKRIFIYKQCKYLDVFQLPIYCTISLFYNNMHVTL